MSSPSHAVQTACSIYYNVRTSAIQLLLLSLTILWCLSHRHTFCPFLARFFPGLEHLHLSWSYAHITVSLLVNRKSGHVYNVIFNAYVFGRTHVAPFHYCEFPLRICHNIYATCFPLCKCKYLTHECYNIVFVFFLPICLYWLRNGECNLLSPNWTHTVGPMVFINAGVPGKFKTKQHCHSSAVFYFDTHTNFNYSSQK
jgi:hypothetical protein